MVRLYAVALENIGIDRALREELNVILLARFFFKYANKLGADDFSLFFRLGNTCQLVEKTVYRIYIDEIGVHLVAEHLDDLLRLALAQQAVVDMDTYQIFADRLDQQRGNDRAVYTAGQRQQYLFVTDLRLQSSDLLVDKCIGERFGGDSFH